MDEQPTVVERHQAAPDPDGATELRFGKRYRPLALLGSGGMGSVYLARDEELDELVALKVMRPDLLQHPSMIERFRDEVRLARLVSSPFVARTHDLAEHEGRWFVTMQYVDGETLSTKLRREGRLPLYDVVRIGGDLCEGLSAIHSAGVVHRDLKPGNVLVSAAGRAVITDFGIALRAEAHPSEPDAGPTHLAATDGSGTMAYAAPEQLAGQALDVRADVFAMGAILYAMAAGEKPFAAARTGVEPAPDPRRAVHDLPDAFARIVMRAMAHDARERFVSAEAVRNALTALRPPEPKPRDSRLAGFVRSLDAHDARKVHLAPPEVIGVSPALFDATRGELLARLHARGVVRVVSESEDAEAVLHSLLASQGDNLTLDLTLRSHDGNYEFWAKTLRGPQASLHTLVETAALDIERAFSPTVTKPLVAPDELPSAEVSRLFVEGRAEYRAFWGGHIERSVQLFERASALAPDHPLITAWCAAAENRLAFFEEGDGRSDAHGRALRAVDLAPELAEARMALAGSHMIHMHVVEAIPHYVQALALAPGLSEQRAHFARLLFELGAESPSLDLATSTFERDPSFTEALGVSLRHHGLRGRMDLADAALRRAPHDTILMTLYGRACVSCRDEARFRALFESAASVKMESAPRRFLDVVSDVFAGRPVTYEMPPVTVAARRRAFFFQIYAEVHAFRGDTRRCLEALESASQLGLFDVIWLDRCALFDELRGTVRFEVVRRATHERALAALIEIERCLSAHAADAPQTKRTVGGA